MSKPVDGYISDDLDLLPDGEVERLASVARNSEPWRFRKECDDAASRCGVDPDILCFTILDNLEP